MSSNPRNSRIVTGAMWAVLAAVTAFGVSTFLLYLFHWGPNVDWGEDCVGSCRTPVIDVLLAVLISIGVGTIAFAFWRIRQRRTRPQGADH